MAESIILELQSLAIDNQNDVADLLRKSLLVASKLKLNDFKIWINNELHGYKQNDVPDYRKVHAELNVKNPYHGLQPFLITNQELADLISNIDIKDSIDSLKSLLINDSKQFEVPLHPQQQEYLMSIQSTIAPLPVTRRVGHNQVSAIIDAVRTTILEWALELESQGIIGNGLTFSAEEKSIANQNSNINIHNFQGILGNVNDSSVDMNLSQSITANDLSSLTKFLKNQGIDQQDLETLSLAIQEDPKPNDKGKFGAKVSQWLGGMINKASNGTWDIGIGAASGLLSEAISKYYGF